MKQVFRSNFACNEMGNGDAGERGRECIIASRLSSTNMLMAVAYKFCDERLQLGKK